MRWDRYTWEAWRQSSSKCLGSFERQLWEGGRGGRVGVEMEDGERSMGRKSGGEKRRRRDRETHTSSLLHTHTLSLFARLHALSLSFSYAHI
jgi:hypothetical protein